VRLIVDASVAIKWVVDESDREAAREFVSDTHELMAPDFLLVEASNILWKKVTRDQIDQSQARRALEELTATFDEFLPTAQLAPQALSLSIALGHPAYDCMYVAAAEQHDGILLTADNGLARALQGTHHFQRVISIGSAAP
jgi:predicted nucleic acid-binding protein